MFNRKQWLDVAEMMWRGVKRCTSENCKVTMSVCHIFNDLVIKTEFPNKNYGGELHRISGKEAIVLGIDIREWSKRDWTVQTIISANLFEMISRVSRILKSSGILTVDTIHIAHTGDGAMIVFVNNDNQDTESSSTCQFEGSCDKNRCLLTEYKNNPCVYDPQKHGKQREINKYTILQALSFLFAINAIVQQDNFSEKFSKIGDDFPYLPLYLRYALSMGRIFPVVNAYHDLECIGSPMVTTSRILSTDHGNHFLVDHKLLHEINKHGGIQNIGNETDRYRWNQNLIISELPEKKVKNGTFRYADVVGFHDDGPLLKALDKGNVQPKKYQIGSHDVSSIYY